MATIQLQVPGMLEGDVEVQANTVQEALHELRRCQPHIEPRLFAGGKLLPTAIVFHNRQRLFQLDKPLQEGDRISVIVAIAGGDSASPATASYKPYLRQIALPHFGLQGQQKLAESRILVIGAGGLGTPVALYLAAAGVGTLGIVDGDRVDVTNLSRQVMYDANSIGTYKVEALRAELQGRNPAVRYLTFPEFLTEENAMDIVRQFDVVVNGSDNFKTRYVLNEACVRLRKPWVDASVLQYAGQLITFTPGNGCYRCLFPDLTDSEVNCSTQGILGPLCGVFGSMQAVQAVKLASGLPVSANTMTYYDCYQEMIETFTWERREDCPCCGAVHEEANDLSVVLEEVELEIDVTACEQLASTKPLCVLYVGATLEMEWEVAGSERRVVMALEDLLDATQEQVQQQFSENEAILCICTFGLKSRVAAEVLQRHGFSAWSLRGGAAELLHREASH